MILSCPNKKINSQDCNCSYEWCPRAGVCCECIKYHRQNNELPACYFSPEAEADYDRSIENFLKISQSDKV